MLIFFDSEQTRLKPIHNNNKFSHSISRLDNENGEEVYTYRADIPWRFDTFTPKHVSDLYHNLSKDSVCGALQQAYEQELGLVEICYGDANNPIQLLITSDLDIEAYQRQWLRAYWQAHRCCILEKKDTHNTASLTMNKGDLDNDYCLAD